MTKFKCQQCNKEFELDTVFMYEVCPDCNGNLFPHNHTDINHKMSTVEQLEAENTTLKSLIARLVEAGGYFAALLHSNFGEKCSGFANWDAAVDEYRAIKGGEK